VLLSGPYALVALVLGGAGIGKVIRPEPLVRALRSLGLPIQTTLGRFGAVAEAGLGAVALVSANRAVALLVAVSFLAFAGFIGVALRRPDLVASCGCFGAGDFPPRVLHLVLDLGLCGIAAAAAVHGCVALPTFVDRRPLLGAVLVSFTCLAGWFVYLAMTTLPRVAVEVVNSAKEGGK
jgi:hypothetical protein